MHKPLPLCVKSKAVHISALRNRPERPAMNHIFGESSMYLSLCFLCLVGMVCSSCADGWMASGKSAFTPTSTPSSTPSPTASSTPTPTPLLDYDPIRGGGVFGPTVCVDPAFAYYQSRPLNDICRDIRARGFTAAHIIRLGWTDPQEERSFADAFRANGIQPVLRIYAGTDVDLYAQYPEWRQKMLGGSDGQFDWRVYQCPNQPDFVAAYQQRIEDSLRNGGYSGLQVAEMWFEQWGGPEESPGVPRAHYACVCDACIAKFRAQTGVNARDLFSSSNALYFRKAENQELYQQWVDFRVQTILNFGQAIIEAARRVDSQFPINIMYLSDARVELDACREYQACDLNRIVLELEPDILTIQDAWQDWIQAGLSPNFVADYATAYRDRVRGLKPDLFIMTHADIGSLPASKRSWEWIQQFSHETVQSGLSAPSFYEWSVSTMTQK